MPYLPCSTCGASMEVNIGDFNRHNMPNTKSDPKKVVGSALCRACGNGTGFEITDNVLNYVSGKSSYGSLTPPTAPAVSAFYSEAEMCFQTGAPNASATMCRAAIETALDQSGFTGSSLYEKIENAKGKKALDDMEVGLAHASRLITRESIHKAELITLSDIPSMLSATVHILNTLVRSQPK